MRRLPEHGSVKSRWQLTFSDMSTLLLTFFVLLFGLSLLSSPPEGTKGSRGSSLTSRERGGSTPPEGTSSRRSPGFPWSTSPKRSST